MTTLTKGDPRTVRYCSRCVYPSLAVATILDDEGVCNACRNSEEFAETVDAAFWAQRKQRFERLVEEAKAFNPNGARWDCVIPVSGGKDSYWQAHICKQYGLKPLLVTYHGNNYMPEGQGNLDRMREVLGCDHMVFGPSIDTLKRLNLAGFRKMGDMNWHCHAGIKIMPMRLAVQLGIPLVVWGEITWTVAGMFAPDDFAEYNKRTVLEHDLRGYTWESFVGEDGLEPADLCWLRFAADEDIDRIGTRGVYIGNFFPWKPNEHTKLVADRYGFEFARQPFERTYRLMSNLDDMHENGLHDYMKFIKFGYGRASDHASKDIRDGLMTREEGIAMVEKYDHVKPQRDLTRWLDYVGIDEAEFDRTADTFRDPRVWWIEGNQWMKNNIRGEPSAYGEVSLPAGSAWERYQ